MKSIFREYDIRGIFEKELNEKTIKLLGLLLGERIKKFGDYVVVGYDARTHSKTLFNYLASGLNRAGVKVLDIGMVPTPVDYFSHYQDFDGIKPSGAVMITGSHNPPEYNGFKITINKEPFFGETIYELGRELMERIEVEVIEDNFNSIEVNGKERYIKYMIDNFQHLKGLNKKIVFDCGNGVAGIVLEEIVKGLELDCEILFKEPDGTFPNHHPDPTEEHNLEDIKRELSKEFELGFAYDGDADRIAVLTKTNNIKGDVLAILFSKKMENPTVIGEVKCSSIMYDEINKIGKSIMYKTGHSNLKVKLKETNASLAAEVSGHIFFNDRYFGFDDAIYATLRTLELIADGMDLDKEIASLPKLYSTEEIKVKTTEDKKFPTILKLKELLKNPPSSMPKIVDIVDVDGVRVIFENGWGLVRASNTTPVLVTRFEATSQELAKLYEDELKELITKAESLI